VSVVKDSKLLSLVLRHEPEKANLVLGEGGWVAVDDLLRGLETLGRAMTRERLRLVVSENDKKRFTLSEDGTRIRAAQGHSVEIVNDLSPLSPPEYLYHGTAIRFLDAIRAQGLKPMSRQHVHLSVDESTAFKVGQRHGKPSILIVLAREMERTGCVFYCADNGVWLTDSVSTQYLKFPDEEQI
jgi:putative RNA 2'-phosphotransferase